MKKNIILTMIFLLLIVLNACSGINSDGEKNDNNNDGKSLAGKNIELIVPQAAGGGTDVIARSIAKIAEEELDASIGVVNKEGGGGAVGMIEGANAEPDGLTLTFSTVELSFLHHLDLAEITPNDFEPIAQVNLDPAAITVSADSPFDSIEDLIDYAKDNPGKLKVGGSGFGAIWHLAAEEFAEENDIDIEFISFDGAAPSVTSLLGGHIDVVTVSPGEILPQVESGDLKTLAIMDEGRSKSMDDVPTLEESDVNNVEVGAWRGITAPKDTPKEIVKELEEAFINAAESEEFEQFMNENGMGIDIKDSKDFGEQMDETSDLFKPLIKKLDIDKEDLEE